MLYLVSGNLKYGNVGAFPLPQFCIFVHQDMCGINMQRRRKSSLFKKKR